MLVGEISMRGLDHLECSFVRVIANRAGVDHARAQQCVSDDTNFGKRNIIAARDEFVRRRAETGAAESCDERHNSCGASRILRRARWSTRGTRRLDACALSARAQYPQVCVVCQCAADAAAPAPIDEQSGTNAAADGSVSLQ